MTDDLELTLQMLVDGELPAGERADLLTRLADTPDGWRRCAEAFIEAQSLRRGLRPPRRSARWARPVALAACLLLALGAGLMWPRAEPPAQYVIRPAVVNVTPPPGMAAAEPVPCPPLFRVRAEDGLVSYTTEHPVPAFMLDAIAGAGHRVEINSRWVELETDDGKLGLPLTETRITPRVEIQL